VTRLSQAFVPTLKDAPADAEAISHKLMVRAGLIRQLGAGLWSYLPAGWRVERKDSGSKRWASRMANAIRSRLLHDDTPDTGCGIKLFERAAFLDLPYFDHMHRYLPALMQRAGWRVKSVPVNHRARGAGVSKYNNLNRALVGISDLRGVAWLIRRSKRTAAEEL
jgi:dolichol-phosphate mannosyltransferase